MTPMPTRNTLRWTLLLAGFAVIAAACGSDGGSVSESAWTATEIADGEVVAGAPPTIIFGATENGSGQVFGSTGCNNIAGGYQIDADTISIGPFATTLAACADPAVSAQETAFLAALENTETFSATESSLELKSADGSVTASFAVLEPTLSLTTWEATGINNGQGGVQSLVDGTMVTLEFQELGFFSGFGGCNTYTSAYVVGDDYDVVEGGSIEVASIASTRKACEEPVMEQEQMYYDALEAARVWLIRGLDLELRSTDGALLVSYTRSAGS